MRTGELLEEVPGFYGVVKMEESNLQKIWAEQDFLPGSLTNDWGQKYFSNEMVQAILESINKGNRSRDRRRVIA